MPGQESTTIKTEKNRAARHKRIEKRRQGKLDLLENLEKARILNDTLRNENTALKSDVKILTQKILDLTKDLNLAKEEIDKLMNMLLD